MSFFKKLFAKRRKAGYYDELKTLGLHIVNDERLAARIEMYRDFHEYIKQCTVNGETPEGTLAKMVAQAHDVNDMLHQLAVPFGRAGSERWYAEAMRGWSVLYTVTLHTLEAVRNLTGRISGGHGYEPEVEKWELIGKVKTFFQTVYLRYALLIAEVSWFREDVSVSWSVVVQQVPTGERPLTTIQQPRRLEDSFE